MLKWTFRENVISPLLDWRQRGFRTCLVTLVSAEGSSPRPLGSQMAVCESGHAVGQITGGCAEHAIIELAKECLKNNENKLIRFGEGSPFLDIKLPCGSSIDVFFNCQIKTAVIEGIHQSIQQREHFFVNFDLTTGDGALHFKLPTKKSLQFFCREYRPTTRLLVVGNGPIAVELIRLASSLEMQTIVVSDDDSLGASLGDLTNDTQLVSVSQLNSGFADPHTAIAVLYHDHEKELPVFDALENGSAFYFGALGSTKTHETRQEILKEAGFSQTFIDNLKAPIGAALYSKNPMEIALAIMAEIVQQKNLLLK